METRQVKQTFLGHLLNIILLYIDYAMNYYPYILIDGNCYGVTKLLFS